MQRMSFCDTLGRDPMNGPPCGETSVTAIARGPLRPVLVSSRICPCHKGRKSKTSYSTILAPYLRQDKRIEEIVSEIFFRGVSARRVGRISRLLWGEAVSPLFWVLFQESICFLFWDRGKVHRWVLIGYSIQKLLTEGKLKNFLDKYPRNQKRL